MMSKIDGAAEDSGLEWSTGEYFKVIDEPEQKTYS